MKREGTLAARGNGIGAARRMDSMIKWEDSRKCHGGRFVLTSPSQAGSKTPRWLSTIAKCLDSLGLNAGSLSWSNLCARQWGPSMDWEADT